tara:strand:- start:2282 stop:5101 length:2820 start_codon:yes stop_codon:yes gene_type:complete
MGGIARGIKKGVKSVGRAIGGAVKGVVGVVKSVVSAVTSVIGDVISWLVPQPEQPDLEQEARSALVNKQSNIEQIPVIYGTRRVGGTIVFVEASGNQNKYLYLCLVLGEGRVEAIGNIYIDDVLLASGSRHFNYVVVDKKVGSNTQPASGLLTGAPSWGDSDTLNGIAYLGLRLTYNADVFSGIPTITADVQGRRLYDPRTGTTAYSSNPALCLRDYLTNPRYGKGLPSSVIDDTTFSTAANDCDVNVDSYDGGASVKAFSCNAVLLTDKTLFNNVKVFLSGMQGIMPYQNGQYRLFIEKDKASTFDFTTDNMIGGFSMAGSSKSSKYNKVTAKFINPEANWQPDSVVWPDSTSTEASLYLSEDSNIELSTETNLTTVTNYYQARNIAKTVLLASRLAGIRLDITATSEALNCVVGDVVTVTHPTPGWNAKQFRVTRLVLNYEGTVAVSLVEHIAAVYPWVKDKVQPNSAQSNLPNPFDNPPPVLSVSDDLRAYNEDVTSVLFANVSSENSFVTNFEVQSRLEGTTEFVNMGQASGGVFEQVNVQDDRIYTVRARTINSINVRSDWAAVDHQVVGKTAPPSDITNLTGNLIGNQYLLTWNAVPDLDLSYYRVRYSSPDSGGSYENSVSLVPKVSRPATSVFVAARSGTYFVKAVDKLGLASLNPTVIVLDSNIGAVEALNVVATLNEAPDFNGTFDDTVELDEDDALVLNTSLAFDALTGDFDDAQGLFDGGSGNVDASGFYYFANNIDLGQVYIARCTANISSVRLDYVALFDSAASLFDSRPGDFDGDVNAFDDTDVQIEARITEDDPAGTPTWSAWQSFAVTDLKARAIEFRAKLSTTDDQATPKVTQLSVTVDMADRTESGDDVVTGAGAKVVTFARAFRNTPAIGIGAQDSQTGDYYEITSKSRTGFTITFKNSSGTAISRSFDYVAKGYGVEL